MASVRVSTVPVVVAALAACAALAGPQRGVSSQVSRFVGCYVVEQATPERHVVDSLHLVADRPRYVPPQTGFRTTFYDDSHALIEFGDTTVFVGPAWSVYGDSLSIGEGMLSGWSLAVRPSPEGFAGVRTTFTDCCAPPLERHAPVVGRRLACPGTGRANPYPPVRRLRNEGLLQPDPTGAKSSPSWRERR